MLNNFCTWTDHAVNTRDHVNIERCIFLWLKENMFFSVWSVVVRFWNPFACWILYFFEWNIKEDRDKIHDKAFKIDVRFFMTMTLRSICRFSKIVSLSYENWLHQNEVPKNKTSDNHIRVSSIDCDKDIRTSLCGKPPHIYSLGEHVAGSRHLSSTHEATCLWGINDALPLV